jgi:uncharacterized protein DUF2188
MARTHDLHVIPDPKTGGWKVIRAGRRVGGSSCQSCAEALGRRLARRNKVDLVTHRRDGRIRSKDSYGNEGPARDTER